MSVVPPVVRICGVCVPFLAGLASLAFHPSGLGAVLAGAGLFLAALYAVCWTALLAHGRTPGKLLAGLRVVHQDGGPAGWRLMLVREVAGKLLVSAALSGVTVGVYWAVDHLWPLWDGRGQAIHDRMAGTVVVRDGSLGRGIHDEGLDEDLGERLARVFGD